MIKWVCDFSNNFNWTKRLNISWEWLVEVKDWKMTIDWIFTIDKQTERLVWTIETKVSDIVEWYNHSFLIFILWLRHINNIWRVFNFSNIVRDIILLKLKTWLNPEEERFIRDYNKMSLAKKRECEDKYKALVEKIELFMISEKEKIMSVLNTSKWIGWWIELF